MTKQYIDYRKQRIKRIIKEEVMLNTYSLLPLLAAGLSGLDSFYSGAIQKPAGYFNMQQINKARKLNQRAKAHHRGCPTAGKSSIQSGVFYSGSKPYINPKTQEKKVLRRKLNLSGKSLRRFQKKMGRLQCSVQ